MYKTTLNRRSSAFSRLLSAFCLLLAAFCLLPGIALAQAERQLTVNHMDGRSWPEVTVNLSLVGSDGKAVPDVQASHFEVLEQGRPQALVGLELGATRSVPLALVLTMDVSGSMRADDKMGQAKEAAGAFLSSLRPEDSAALLAFDDQVQEVVPLTSDRAALQAGVSALQTRGNTAIYDALHASVRALSKAPPEKRRAIVLLTDGADTSSSYSPEVAADVAKEAGALVYAIGLGPDANDAVLRSLTEPSGGKYYKAPTAADLQAIYAAISVELDSQLFLRYHSTTRVSRNYELVKVQVKYTAPDGQVLVRTVSYRPPTAALLPKQPGSPTRALAPFATPFAVPLPAGMAAKSTQSAPTGKVSLHSTVTSWVAAFLASVAALLGTIGLAIVLSPSITSRRVDRYLIDSAVGPGTSDRGKSFAARVVVPFVENIGRKIAGLGPKSYVELIQSLLTLTGPPYRMTVGGFLGIQLVLTTFSVVLIMAWVAGSNPETAAQWILALLVAALVGLYLPYFWLKRRVTRRKKALLRALPGALDFLAINVEAGLGFDAALAQVVKRWRNTLTDEFALLLIDFQIGKARKDAWKELIERTQVAELTTFITAMLQNEQVGVSISTLLRTQADQMRVRRRQAAEESARTAPVKMLLPMVFFIFPSIFVIILGPAIPQFLGTFTQMGK